MASGWKACNDLAYTGEREGEHVTLLENNYVDRRRPNTCEATLVYLIRRGGELDVHIDRHELGLFSQTDWETVFPKHALNRLSNHNNPGERGR